VLAYVPGHTHENRITPFSDGDAEFWELNTSAVADWPQQNRLIEIMDNGDGTLSIITVVTDHGSKIGIPRPGSANGFSITQLGALGRTFSFNDPQSSRFGNSEGDDEDRNVELLIDDPRESATPAPTSGDDGEEGEGEEPPPDTETTPAD
jgi:hypothetical protein